MDLKTFMLAGNATFTVTSRKTGNRFTYKVCRAKATGTRDVQRPVWFVMVLTGPDNQHDYSYAGMLAPIHDDRLLFRLTSASKLPGSATSVAGFKWLVGMLNAGKPIEDQAEVHHEGRCGRCGRALTVPESIETGLGPECATKVAS